MNFDTVQLAAVTEELNRTVTGSRIDKVSQPEPLELILGVYKDNVKRNLLISAAPDVSRIHLIKQRSKPNPAMAPAFCMLLRKYLEGGTVDEIVQPLGFSERVLRFRIKHAQTGITYLWVEVMGRQSNVVLTTREGMILGVIKRVTSSMSRLREVRTGIPYSPPPKQLGYKRDPMEAISGIGLPPAEIHTTDDAEKWLISTFRGIGSLFAKEIVLRCTPCEFTPEKTWLVLSELLQVVQSGTFEPVVYRDDRGQVEGAYPFPLRSVPTERQESALSISDALEYVYANLIEDDAFSRERNAILASLRKAKKAAERQILDIREGLVNADNSGFLRESGELLLSNSAQIESGLSEVTVVDYFSAEPDAVRTIAVDETMNVQENAQRYFRKFQKARDSRESLEARRVNLERSLAEIETALSVAEAAENGQEISELADRVGSSLRQTQYQQPGQHPEPSPYDGHKIKSYRSPDGWEILIGENSTSNDYLTTKVASPSDIWLHARAVPSAHAVIRSQNRPASVSTAALMLAAEQVAKRSSAKHARLVSVDYTLKKYVRKPRGSAPGQVTYTNEKTLDVVARAE